MAHLSLTDNHVPSKTPDEIKKANECCASVTSDCNGCPYEEMPNFVCFKQKCLDTLAYIRQLELQNALLTAEKSLNNALRKRIRKAHFTTSIDLMTAKLEENYAIAKNHIAHKLAEFLLKEGAIVFCEVYRYECEMEEIVGRIDIVMPEPPKEE